MAVSSQNIRVNPLIDWARRQKRLGKLKQAFIVYTWMRKIEVKSRAWWRRDVIRCTCQLGIVMHPNWRNGHYALGVELRRRYSALATKASPDVVQLTRVGNRAIDHLRKALELDPKLRQAYDHLISILGEMGRIDEASLVLQQSEETKHKLAEALQTDKLGLRFISSRIAGSVGFIANLDCYVKAGLLGWRPPHEIFMLLPEGSLVSNPCALDYWRKYVNIISEPGAIAILSPLTTLLEDPIHWALTCNDQTYFTSAAYVMVHKQWESENRPPLLNLSSYDNDRGWKCLRGLGIPEGAWFVCIHVREPGFKDRGSSFDSYRNANVDTYSLAIETIVAHGGWVIRMGDPSMKRLSPMKHVIDYAHNDVRSDWMDVFLSAQCRFFIATSSGLGAISVSFGVPMVQTNYLPWGTMWSSSKDLFLPRLLWSKKEQRNLTFNEILSSPLSGGVSQSFYDNAGVEVIENTPEEINDIVSEMLNRLDGKLTYTKTDEQLQERIRSLTAVCNSYLGAKDLKINCRVGKDFLCKYSDLTELESKHEILKTD